MKEIPLQEEAEIRFRTLFISDVHLGTKGCQSELFLDFLKHHDADTIFLVGDIVDGWRLKGGWYWPQMHNDIVQKLLRKVRKGTRMVYIPGNHDEFMRDYAGLNFGGVEVMLRTVHVTADNRRLLIVHGDEFDVVVRHAKWLAYLGDWAYEVALFLNTYFNIVRRWLGFGYWSFSAWAKLKVKNAVNFIGTFETALAEAAARERVDGIVCGHIHHAVIRDMHGVQYINIGDFVESCTVIAEYDDGRLEIIPWKKTMAARNAQAGTSPIAAQVAA